MVSTSMLDSNARGKMQVSLNPRRNNCFGFRYRSWTIRDTPLVHGRLGAGLSSDKLEIWHTNAGVLALFRIPHRKTSSPPHCTLSPLYDRNFRRKSPMGCIVSTITSMNKRMKRAPSEACVQRTILVSKMIWPLLHSNRIQSMKEGRPPPGFPLIAGACGGGSSVRATSQRRCGSEAGIMTQLR